jgi:membrane protein
MIKTAYIIIRETIEEYIADEALTRGAAIAYYTVTSLAPMLVIVVAIAGLVFGESAAQGAIVDQVSSLIGHPGAKLLQEAVINASKSTSGSWAALISVVALFVTASGVFVELQNTLNKVWNIETTGNPVSRLIRARAASLGLVIGMGFLLIVSLIISALLSGLSSYVDRYFPDGSLVLRVLDFVISFSLIALIFGAIYKVLPNKNLEWRHVIIGGITTAFLFQIGKFFIGLYLGRSAIASSYGAAGALMVLLIWFYYSAQIFLFGAEFTKVYTKHIHGYVPDEIANILDED